MQHEEKPSFSLCLVPRLREQGLTPNLTGPLETLFTESERERVNLPGQAVGRPVLAPPLAPHAPTAQRGAHLPLDRPLHG